MKKYFSIFLTTVIYAIIGEFLLGKWGLVMALVISPLTLIYVELVKITTLLKEQAKK